MSSRWIIGGAGSVLLFISSAAVQAAPLGVAGGISTAAHETSAVEQVASRRCWWRNGARHCRQARSDRRDYGEYQPYGRARPEDLRTGSTAWWRAMDEEGRGGHGRTP